MQHHFLIILALLCLGTAGCAPWNGWYHHNDSNYASNHQHTAARQFVRIRTHRRGAYYLIDRTRRLCYFQNYRTLVNVPCSSIPEARALLATSRRAPQHTPHVQTRPGRTPVHPKTPANVRRTAPAPQLGAKPTQVEIGQFREAYKAIYCAGRKGGNIPPAKIIVQFKLSVERYSQIEGWLAQNPRAWSQISRSAFASCK